MFDNNIAKLNICYTNNTRKKVNEKLMKRYKPDNSITLKSLHEKIDPNSQEVYLYEGLPVIGKVNNLKQNIVNNKTYKVISIRDDVVVIMDSENEEIKKYNDMMFQLAKDKATKTKKAFREPSYKPLKCVCINISNFQYLFYPAYCITTHKAQGGRRKA